MTDTHSGNPVDEIRNSLPVKGQSVQLICLTCGYRFSGDNPISAPVNCPNKACSRPLNKFVPPEIPMPNDKRPQCLAFSPAGYTCTDYEGHPGNHVALDSDNKVVDQWSPAPTSADLDAPKRVAQIKYSCGHILQDTSAPNDVDWSAETPCPVCLDAPKPILSPACVVCKKPLQSSKIDSLRTCDACIDKQRIAEGKCGSGGWRTPYDPIPSSSDLDAVAAEEKARQETSGLCLKPTKYHLIAGASHYLCALVKGHEGECQPGGTCFTHGLYVGATKCPQWPNCAALETPARPASARSRKSR